MYVVLKVGQESRHWDESLELKYLLTNQLAIPPPHPQQIAPGIGDKLGWQPGKENSLTGVIHLRNMVGTVTSRTIELGGYC